MPSRSLLEQECVTPEAPRLFPQGTALTDLPALVGDTEAAWVTYLSRLDEQELARMLEWEAADGRRYRWDVEGILTQVFGHAWYHRGQIAQLVPLLGGKTVDTDYILWCQLTPIESAGS
jgi:uncharacterized damage-inducible protein DinB